MKIYIGLKEKVKPAIFENEKESTTETHPQFGVIYGPFKNTEDAQKFVAAMDQGVACSEG